jgi:hypothetical protein
LSEIRSVAGGTLGIGFTALLGARPVFLKTHSLAEGRTALLREAKLLACAYPRSLNVAVLEPPGADRVWLVCDRLEEVTAGRTPDCIAQLVSEYQLNLTRSSHRLSGESFTDFADLLAAGRDSLERLAANSLLPTRRAGWLETVLSQLEQAAPRQPRVLCHGDLSPRNILQSSNQLVAIDWEDAFLGIPGYDQLFWLTFMENAPHLRQGWVCKTRLAPELERGLAAVIVLIKSRMALDSGAIRQHRVTPNQRLGEIEALPDPRPS